MTAAKSMTKRGFDWLSGAMRLEREYHMAVAPYERSSQRQRYANGYKLKTVESRIGAIHLAVPQVREGGCYPASPECVLTLAPAEISVLGASTRKVARMIEQLCDLDGPSTEVSHCNEMLDDELSACQVWPLGAFRTRRAMRVTMKMRHGSSAIDYPVLLTIGVDTQGKRELLGVAVALFEAEVRWRNFLQSLAARGLHCIRLFVSDNQTSLEAARIAVYPFVVCQRSQFHLQRNVGHYVPSKLLKRLVAAAIHAVTVFDVPNPTEAICLIKRFIQTCKDSVCRFAERTETVLPTGLVIRGPAASSLQATAYPRGHAVLQRGRLPAVSDCRRHGYLAKLANRMPLLYDTPPHALSVTQALPG